MTTNDPYHLDYETRSKADLKKVGAYRYAEDTTTEILMAAVSRGEGDVYLWVNPAHETPELMSDPRAHILLQEMTADPDAVIFAHNAEFERAVTKYRMTLDMGFLPPGTTQWRCTAAMARRAALPAKLEKLGEVLGLTQQKDARGAALIRKFSIPVKKTGEFTPPASHPADFAAFGNYCVQDVRTEKAVHRKLKVFELKDAVLDTFNVDAIINDRGLPVNVPALRNAQRIIDEVTADITQQFLMLTGILPTQREAVKKLLSSMGLDLENMTADTLEKALEDLEKQLATRHHPDGVSEDEWTYLNKQHEVLSMYGLLSYAAAKKVTAMLACVCTDGRVRGTLLYYGAGTGRWSGKLIQPQNFKKPTLDKDDCAMAYKMICEGCTREELEVMFGNAMEVIASVIRYFIQWTDLEGNILGELFDADYAAIEARIVCWLAGQEDVLDTFRKADAWTGPKELKPDVYKDMAGEIYNKAFKDITADERTVGKHTILGCGFAMWWPKFIETCAKFGVVVAEELAKKAVLAYREMCYKVEELWGDVERAAKNAITAPGKVFKAGPHLRFTVVTSEGIPFLVMRLPSGRNIVYPWPKLEPDTRRDNKLGITFYGQIPGKQIWGRINTYGGKLVENATQGTAADIMSHGACNAERKGFPIATLIHDQALALKLAMLKLGDFIAALIDLPAWAVGLPIASEGKVVPYYKK
jgi:DNA polymerase bacteriophage-type